MNLQELLQSFELSEDQVAQVNQAVDGVIEGKLAGKADEIKALEDSLTATQGDLDNANAELAPVKDAAQKEKLGGLMPEGTDPSMHADIVALSGLEDGDDDATIQQKLADTVDSRDYFKKAATADKAVAKTETETKTPESKEKTEDTQAMPQGVK